MSEGAEIVMLATENAALRILCAELREALETTLPRLAHKFECHSTRPTSEWAEHGSVSFENCMCERAIVQKALAHAKELLP